MSVTQRVTFYLGAWWPINIVFIFVHCQGFVVWSATAPSSSTNMTFRNVNLIENDDVVTFALPAKIQDVTDLSIYEANGNIDIRGSEWLVDYIIWLINCWIS